jgi:hypothetical protein
MENTPTQTPHTLPSTLEPVVEEHRIGLPMALGIAISIAIIFTMIGLTLYLNGAAGLDLSKPGFKNALTKVVNQDQATTTFDTTSPITPKSIDDTIKNLQKQKDELTAYGNFGTPVLEDTSLGINDNADQQSTVSQ